ncbi:MAG: hypothetical protein Q8P93_00155 [bacterium]|nr:hypothetical protein [bacterium]
MKTLSTIINNLNSHPDVDAVFITGSQGSEHKPYSDIDLVVIFTQHTHDLTSLYTWIDHKFSDIFFFDHADLKRIDEGKELPGNEMDAVFVSWLQKATIQFDTSGKTTALKDKIDELGKQMVIPKSEKDMFWQKINYNYVANMRYFESQDPAYHEALDVRLLYSVIEVFTGYFAFRGILWRGEKTAIKYLKKNDIPFYDAFVAYTNASDRNERVNRYTQLVKLVFTDSYVFWNKGDVIPLAKDMKKMDQTELIRYWGELIG